jgi:predicted RNA-binding Zn-ribbon protein involved in translation (DUF1610 family)
MNSWRKPVQIGVQKEDGKDTYALSIKYETPYDLEGDSWIHMHRKQQEFAKLLGGDTELTFQRICDGCRETINFMEKGLDFKCSECSTRFDLCRQCQSSVNKETCPDGYGCGLYKIDLGQSQDMND